MYPLVINTEKSPVLSDTEVVQRILSGEKELFEIPDAQK